MKKSVQQFGLILIVMLLSVFAACGGNLPSAENAPTAQSVDEPESQAIDTDKEQEFEETDEYVAANADVDEDSGDTSEISNNQVTAFSIMENSKQYFVSGDSHVVLLNADGTVTAVGDNEYGQCDVSDWRGIAAVSAAKYITAGLKSDGTVVCTDPSLDLSGWHDIVKIQVYCGGVVGLQSSGHVLSTDDDTSGWTDITDISALGNVVGLKSDGTVVATIDRWDLSGLQNIAAIYDGYYFIAAVNEDGVLSIISDRGESISYEDGDIEVLDGCNDVAAVSLTANITMAVLKKDGTVDAVGFDGCWDGKYGYNPEGSFSSWKDIVALASNYEWMVGLKSDGTVVYAGGNTFASGYIVNPEISEWQDIVAIACGEDFIAALRSDCSIVTAEPYVTDPFAKTGGDSAQDGASSSSEQLQ